MSEVRKSQHTALPAGRFRIFCPTRMVRKAGVSGEPPKRVLEGLISSDRRDLQDEKVIQKGLDFGYFLSKRGTFNDEHKPGHKNILAVPTKIQRYEPGETLPDGKTADRPCTWASGEFLNDPSSIESYNKGRALQAKGRSLGLSIEGKILRRAGPRGDIIAQAEVHHVAICHEPVNPDAQMTTLLRSLKAARALAAKRSGKAMQVGPDVPGGKDNPLVRQDKNSRIVDLAGRGGAKRPKKRRRPPRASVAKKSRQAPNLVQSLRAAFPHVGEAYAVMLAAELDRQPQRKLAWAEKA